MTTSKRKRGGDEPVRIVGRHPVIELLLSRPKDVRNVFLLRGAKGEAATRIDGLCRDNKVSVQRVDRRWFEEQGRNTNHQGVLAEVAPRAPVALRELLDTAAKKGEPALLVVLDQIQDPHNVGAIVRTAAAVGADGVVVGRHRSASISPTVAKVAAGATEHTPIAIVTNTARALDEMKAAGIWIVGTDGSANQSLYETDLSVPLAFVIGNEARGLRRLVREKCDLVVKIPIPGRAESLNASVAAGVLLYEAFRQRVAP